MTIRQAVAAAGERLSGDPHLADTARRDAELLLLHALGIPRSTMHAYPGRLLSAAEAALYQAAVDRRSAREPVQYIVGRQEFFGLDLEVGPGVLIPRPETELLVEAALGRLPRDRAVELLDVGTGSGAIAVAMAAHLPLARVVAVDLSEAALAMAARNVRRHRLAGRVELLRSDLLAAVAGRHFDAVLSNPPYVPQADRESLHPQVRDHEPEMALFAGENGLEIYRRLLPAAEAALVPRGLLAMEMGWGQGGAVAGMLAGWDGVQLLDDLQGIARVVVARRRA